MNENVNNQPRVRMAELTRPEFEARIRTSVIILPVGSTEQHGPHLPLGADALQVDEIAVRVAREAPAIVAPTLPYGSRSGARSGGGEIFSGTTSLSGEALTLTVRERGPTDSRGGRWSTPHTWRHRPSPPFAPTCFTQARSMPVPRRTFLPTTSIPSRTTLFRHRACCQIRVGATRTQAMRSSTVR